MPATCGTRGIGASGGGLEGGGIVDRPGQERLAQNDAADARIAQTADSSQVADAARHEQVDVVGPDRGRSAEPGPVRCRRGQGRTAGRPARPARRRVRAGSARSTAATGTRRTAPAAGRGRPPASRRRPRAHARSSSGSSTTLIASTTRVAPAAKASRIWSAALHAAGQLERRRDPGRDQADRLEVGRLPAAGAVEVDEVDEPRAELHEVVRDPLGPVGRGADAARRAGPEDDPRATGLEVDRRDDLHPAVSGPLCCPCWRPHRRAAGGGS